MGASQPAGPMVVEEVRTVRTCGGTENLAPAAKGEGPFRGGRKRGRGIAFRIMMGKRRRQIARSITPWLEGGKRDNKICALALHMFLAIITLAL